MPEVMHIWPEVKSIIRTVNQFLKPFLNIFGVKDSNVLFPFAIDIEGPGDQRELVEYFFFSLKKYPRVEPKDDDTMDGTDNGYGANYGATLSGGRVPGFMNDVDLLALE